MLVLRVADKGAEPYDYEMRTKRQKSIRELIDKLAGGQCTLRVGVSRALAPQPDECRRMLNGLMNRFRWSQSDVAAVLGVRQDSISRWKKKSARCRCPVGALCGSPTRWRSIRDC